MRNALWLIFACTCCGLGFILGHRPPPRAVGPAVVAHVNGQEVSAAELDRHLTAFRPQALEQLVQLKLLEHEAERQGISLETRRDRAQALIRALILKEAGPQELQQVYASCREELALYDCSVMLFRDEESEEAALEKLAARGNFADLAHSYSQDELTRSQGGHLGWVTLPQLKARYGPNLAEEALLVGLNKVSRAVAAPYGSMIVLVHARKQGFEDLREACERVLVEARTTELLARLASQAKVGP